MSVNLPQLKPLASNARPVDIINNINSLVAYFAALRKTAGSTNGGNLATIYDLGRNLQSGVVLPRDVPIIFGTGNDNGDWKVWVEGKNLKAQVRKGGVWTDSSVWLFTDY